jgi:type IVB pilus formation R64 PilN family outer membrane protein
MKKLSVNMKTISLLMVGAGLLTGCAATNQANDRYVDFKANTEKKYEGGVVKSSVSGSLSDEAAKTANFGKSSRNWIDPNPLPRLEAKVVLPEIFRKNVSMTMPGTVNAPEVLSEMQRSTGIKFEIGTDIYDTTPGQGKILTAGAPSASQVTKPNLLLIPDFVFRGTLEDALNLLAAKANVSWKWNGREVEIYRYETKTYNIAALAGSTKTASNVDLKGDTSGSAASSEGGGTAANAGSNSSNVSRNATLTTWDEVKTFLVSQMSANGSIAVLESTGAVTVKDVPAVHKRLEKSINELNTLLTRQIFLNVDIYTVNASDKDTGSIDWNLVWQGSQNKFGYQAANTAPSGAGQFSIGVLKGPFSGTNVVLGALSTLGKASILNQFQVTTLNGQPTPIASNRKVGYLKEVKVTTTASSGSGTSEPTYDLKPGEVSAGINLNITPKLEPSGNILMEYTMNLSDIEDIRKFTAPNGSQIELPTSNLKSVLQRATLRSGQTLVLSGFKQSTSSTTKAGVGSPGNMLLGGSHSAEVNDQYLVITVTPYIANNNSGMKR